VRNTSKSDRQLAFFENILAIIATEGYFSSADEAGIFAFDCIDIGFWAAWVKTDTF